MAEISVVVIIPVHNRRRMVFDALESVRRQTTLPDKLVVVDDGSTDDTPEKVRQWLERTSLEFPAQLLTQRQRGAAAARNRGVAAAEPCDWLAFLDSDDLWPADFLTRMAITLSRNDKAIAATADCRFRPPGGESIVRIDHRPLADNAPEWLFFHDARIMSASLFRREAFEHEGGFDESLQIAEDADLFFRLSLTGPWLHSPGEPVTYRIEHSDSDEAANLCLKYDDKFRRCADVYERMIQQHGGKRFLARKRYAPVLSRWWYRAGRELMRHREDVEARQCFRRSVAWRFWNKAWLRIPQTFVRRSSGIAVTGKRPVGDTFEAGAPPTTTESGRTTESGQPIFPSPLRGGGIGWRGWTPDKAFPQPHPDLPSSKGTEFARAANDIDVTIGICTWNRATLLDQTLSRLGDLNIPRGLRWELLVVNNNCSDDTDEVAHRHANHLPLRLLHEPQPGKSVALNTATAAARGELILWTDDDVLIDPEWLTEYLRVAEAHPNASFFGGPIEPWFEETPPTWLTDCWPRLSCAYATRLLTDISSNVQREFLPYGANFAIRTSVQRRFPYDNQLGRVGASEVRGEETVLIERLLDAGHEGRWAPAAKVLHFLPKERLTLDYLRRFYFGAGQTAALTDTATVGSTRGFWPRTRIWTKAALNRGKFRLGRGLVPADVWIKHFTKSHYYLGCLHGESPVANSGCSDKAAA